MSRVHSLAFTVTEETFPGTNQHELQSVGTAAATTALRHTNCPARSECTAISGAYHSKSSQRLAEDHFGSSVPLLQDPLTLHPSQLWQGKQLTTSPTCNRGQNCTSATQTLTQCSAVRFRGNTWAIKKSILYTGDGETAWILTLFIAGCCVDYTALAMLGVCPAESLSGVNLKSHVLPFPGPVPADLFCA